MSGGKARYFITLILLLPLVAACAPESLGFAFESDNSSLSATRQIQVIPRRDGYKAGEYFKPAEDLYVNVINEGGTVEPVPVNKVSIGIVTNPDAANPSAPIAVPSSGAQLVSAIGTGRKLVVVKYSGLEPATYSIEVQDILGGGGGGTDNGSGFHIIWK